MSKFGKRKECNSFFFSNSIFVKDYTRYGSDWSLQICICVIAFKKQITVLNIWVADIGKIGEMSQLVKCLPLASMKT